MSKACEWHEGHSNSPFLVNFFFLDSLGEFKLSRSFFGAFPALDPAKLENRQGVIVSSSTGRRTIVYKLTM